LTQGRRERRQPVKPSMNIERGKEGRTRNKNRKGLSGGRRSEPVNGKKRPRENVN